MSYLNGHVPLGNYRGDDNAVCPCCVGFLQKKNIDCIVASARETLQAEAAGHTVGWSVFYPPVLDVIRIATRTVIIQSPYKLSPFPTFQELYEKLLTKQTQEILHIAPPQEEGELTVRPPPYPTPHTHACC